MSRFDSTGEGADRAKPAQSGDPDRSTPSPPDLEARIKAASIARAKILAAKRAASQSTPDSPPPIDRKPERAISVTSRLRAAREARDKVLAERATMQTDPDAASRENGPAERAGARPRPPSKALEFITSTRGNETQERPGAVPLDSETEVEVPIAQISPVGTRKAWRVSTYSALAVVLVGAMVLLAWTLPPLATRPEIDARIDELPGNPVSVAVPAEQAAAPALGPGSFDMIVVAGQGANVDGDRFGVSEYELRSTPFHVSQSTVQYFNSEDKEAATNLAMSMDADVVDLRGLRPSPPEGRIVVYLAAGQQ